MHEKSRPRKNIKEIKKNAARFKSWRPLKQKINTRKKISGPVRRPIFLVFTALHFARFFRLYGAAYTAGDPLEIASPQGKSTAALFSKKVVFGA